MGVLSAPAALFYNTLGKRASTRVLTMVVGALIYERVLDDVCSRTFSSVNQGKLWRHIKHQYEDKD